MGMSHDFHVAIEEGATMVRVGTAIFGERPQSAARRSSMKVTPLDLRQQKFKTVMRGYDRAEVESFLNETADDYETGAARRRSPARRPGPRAVQPRRASRRRAQPAQHAADRAEAGRRDPAERRVRGQAARPRGRGPRRPAACRRRRRALEEVQREIDGLRLKRRDVENSLESHHRDPAQLARVRARAGRQRSATTRCCSTGRASVETPAAAARCASLDELKVAEA